MIGPPEDPIDMTSDGKLSADDLARLRTAMAADRTLMSWVRTTLAMIGLGFTITKFYQYLQATEPLHGGQDPHGPRNLGLVLILLGLLSLTMAGVQYAGQVRRLDASARPLVQLPLIVAAIVALIGAFALLNLMFGVGPF
jgi:putative membrane protein